MAMLLAKSRSGADAMGAREALEVATRGGAACLGRQGEIGELSVGAAADLALWRLDGVTFAGAISDPIEALLRCGPTSAHYTIVAGKIVVEQGSLVSPDVENRLARHRVVAEHLQGPLDQ